MPNFIDRLFGRENLPQGIRAELVDMLFTNHVPVIAMGMILTGTAAVISFLHMDIIAAVIALAAACTSVLRMRLLYNYRAHTTGSLTDDAEAIIWERRFARLSILMGGLVGALGLRTLLLNDPYLALLSIGIVFGFAAGLIVRTCMRPVISFRSLFTAVVPVVIGLVISARTQTEAYGEFIYYTLTVLIIGFALASVESLRHVYQSIVHGLVTRRDLSALAGTDLLTGLPNRRVLPSRFREGAERIERQGNYMAVHCVDLDYFKAVNDEHGHAAGDALLQAASQRIAGALATGDTVARVGGDEFVLIQPSIQDKSNAEALARRIIRALGEPFNIGGLNLRIGATIGIALMPKDGDNLELIMHHADQALYQAKACGRGSVCIWGDDPIPARAAA